MKWQIVKVLESRLERDHPGEGWEPFAVTEPTAVSGARIWFRKATER